MYYPLITVIIPIYKVEKYLPKCLDSVLAQTYSNLEIILVDDGSPDNCGAICDEYAARDSRIRVIHKENGGLSSARNSGIDICRGKYISFIDSDDFVSPYFIEMLYRGVHDFNCEIATVEHGVSFMEGKDDSVVFAKDKLQRSYEEIQPNNCQMVLRGDYISVKYGMTSDFLLDGFMRMPQLSIILL